MIIVSIALGVLAAALLLLGALLILECLCALIPRWGSESKSVAASRPGVAVVVPAHNESEVLGATIRSIQDQLEDGDRLMVVADNCSDDTANIARSLGAEVVERRDETNRGKGFALDAGLKALQDFPPDVVVFMDADCWLEPRTLGRLASAAWEESRPAQAIYLMNVPKRPSLRDRLSCFAFFLKNRIRPLGFHRLGLPCHLTGTGIAVRWNQTRSVGFATSNIVEDMCLGLEFARKGAPPLLVPEAGVFSVLPGQKEAATSQRTRWEHGHLQTIEEQIPQLIKSAIQRRDVRLFALGIDLLIPPLSLFVLLSSAVWVASIGAWFLGGSMVPVVLGACLLGLIGLSVLIAWCSGGAAILSLKDFLSLPLYLLWKVPLYLRYFTKGAQKAWVRTERSAHNPNAQ